MALLMQSSCMEADDIGTGASGIAPDECAPHHRISGEYDARTSDVVLFDGVVEIIILRLYQTEAGFGIMCHLE